MTKLSKKNKIIVGVAAVVIIIIAGYLIADAAIRSQKRAESVEREAKSILSIYRSAVVYNSLAVPSDDQIAKMLPTNAETITSVTTSGEPSTDTAVVKTGEKCDGSTDSSKTAAVVHVLLPNKSPFCVD